MENFYANKIIDAKAIFNDHFVDGRMLFLYHFNRLPSHSFIGQVDGEKVFESFREKFADRIRYVHQYKWFHRSQKKYAFDRTLVVLDYSCVIEFDDSYCEIYHDESDDYLVETFTGLATRFKQRQRRQPLEINLIVQDGKQLRLRALEIKRVKLDLGLYYEDNFREVDETIRKRLNQKNDKGIVLLHGLPGTGKTTYLRYLVGKIRKRVLFLSPAVADNLLDPSFVELMINNPNTVVIIEDAEEIIMDRKRNTGSSVSNLLNISDGLLADFLNVQLICTFNSSLNFVDQALMRKGRLIAQYEFGKLDREKAQRLSDHLGHKQTIDGPMTIAEITNPGGQDKPVQRTEVIGFRQQEEWMN